MLFHLLLSTCLLLSATTNAAPPRVYNDDSVACGRLADGNYAMLRESCSKMYITCDGGLSITRECPGNLRFDSTSGDCLANAFVEACGGTPTTTPAGGYPTQPQREQPKIDFACESLDDGFYSHPDRPCSTEFYSCVGGVAAKQVCAESVLRFDTDTSRCLDGAFVKACGGKPTVPPKEIQREESKIEFSCESRSLGNHADPHNECSNVFWSCVGKVGGVRRTCALDTFYDAELNQCLFHADVPACSGTPRPPPTEEEPQQEQPTFAPVPFDCSTKADGTYLLSEYPCSNVFYQCVSGVAKEINCPTRGLRFDTEIEACVSPSMVKACASHDVFFGFFDDEQSDDSASSYCQYGYNQRTGSCNQQQTAPAPVEPTEEPVPVYPQQLPTVVDPASCVNGYNPSTRSCVANAPIQPVTPACAAGSSYDSSARRCVATNPPAPIRPVVPACAAGSSYDSSARRCVATNPTAPVRPAVPYCASGSSYDSSARRCVVNQAPTAPSPRYG